ncbi:MgtC/SapB family protein [Niveibacterium sp. SC-1]|uniref:MgtC/SapB family protein n=1 Tax=Niveibacterium sp. SC-1 TaxID=3135646 RepID=UPI00311DCD5A
MFEGLQHYWTPELLAANLNIFLHVLAAAVIGAAVGYERSYHGRAAGMRTYALVCLASAALTVVCAFPQHWFGDTVAVPNGDPTRIIQGLMTGVGFLGAGMIMRDGLTIHGLSTAASVWVTAAIGILVGLGFHAAAAGAAILTVLLMSAVRTIERLLPQSSFIHCSVRYLRNEAPQEAELMAQAARCGFEVTETSYQLAKEGQYYEYRLTLRSFGTGLGGDFARALASDVRVREFKVSPQRE